MLLLLLKVRIVGLWNTAWHTAGRHKVLAGALTAGGVLIAVAIYEGFRGFLLLMNSRQGQEEMVYQAFYFLFLFLLAGALPFVASTLLQSADYLLLGVAPVRDRWVVAAKLIDAAVSNSVQFLVIGVPALAACASVLGVPPAAWPVLAIVVALFALLPALLMSLVLLLCLSVFGGGRVRAAIAGANALTATAVCLTMVVQANSLPLRQGFQSFASPQAAMPSVLARFGPSGWFAEALTLFARGSTYQGSLDVLRLVALVIAIYALCLLLGDRVLSTAALAEEGEGTSPALVDPSPVRSSRHGLLRLFTPPVAALVAKDLRYVMRDSILLSQLGMPFILFLVPFVLALQGAAGALMSTADLYPFVVAMTAIIVFMQTSILSLTSIGMENRSFWLVLTSPNGARTVLWAKFAMSTLVSGGAGVFLTAVGAVAFRAQLAQAATLALVTALAATALCGMGVGISAALPRFVYDNPAHRVSAWALILGFLCTTVYLALSVTLLGGCYLTAAAGLGPPALVYAAGGALFLLLTITAAYLPMSIGVRRIERYQWEH